MGDATFAKGRHNLNVTPENITELKPGEIFVFGSNYPRGRHGLGAAKLAREKFGAQEGVGLGRTGSCYAIPTKDQWIETLPLEQIAWYIQSFLQYAAEHPELKFLVTAIGCGLASLNPWQIAPLFFAHPIPANVSLPASFWKIKETP